MFKTEPDINPGRNHGWTAKTTQPWFNQLNRPVRFLKL